jgi:hypothetical protein
LVSPLQPALLEFHAEAVCVLLQNFLFNFPDFIHTGGAGAALQFATERAKLLFGTDGVNLDAAIAQVLCISGDSQASGNALRKEAESHSLHDSGYEKAPGLEHRRRAEQGFYQSFRLLAARENVEMWQGVM